jgi:AcrR family transcriptional regulator
MISSAAALIGAHGLSGTSFSDVLADSGAPRGSIYYHFPGGKKQLAEQLRAAGLPARQAAPIAIIALASMEGALVTCRAERGSEPLETVARELLRLLP